MPTEVAPPNSAIWTPNVATAGSYQVYAQWTANPNRATNATYTVTHAAGATPVAVNQQANGGVWNLLGTYSFAPGTTHKVTLTDQANGFVIGLPPIFRTLSIGTMMISEVCDGKKKAWGGVQA